MKESACICCIIALHTRRKGVWHFFSFLILAFGSMVMVHLRNSHHWHGLGKVQIWITGSAMGCSCFGGTLLRLGI